MGRPVKLAQFVCEMTNTRTYVIHEKAVFKISEHAKIFL